MKSSFSAFLFAITSFNINKFIVLLENDNDEERYTMEPGAIQKETAANIYGDINESPEFRLSVNFGPTT